MLIALSGSFRARLNRCRRVICVIRAVVFDVGECLVNETREYGTWADWLGVPRHTFSAVFGAVIARGLDYRETFQVFKPGFDLDEGFWLGVAGNQTVRAGRLLRELSLPVDMVATSDDWGVTKPDPGFFDRLAKEVPYAPAETLYVGDRLENDIRPASETGLRTALIRRGPWGVIEEHDPDADRVATVRITSLRELPARISEVNAGAR